jgi:molecular chaperone Hsp33
LENKDICKKYLACNKNVIVIAINGTKMVSDAKKVHDTSEIATVVLGETLIATTLMSSMLKEETNRMTVQIKGDGEIGNIIVCSNNSLKVKGYVSNPIAGIFEENQKELTTSKAIGKGYLNIIKDIGLKEPYIGFSNLTYEKIEKDFEDYFKISEQTESIVKLGVKIDGNSNVKIAGGYIIQPLPNCEKNIMDNIYKINNEIEDVTDKFLDLNNINEVVKKITGDNSIECIYEKEPKYECDCNNDRIEKTIIALGKENAMKTLEENNNKIEVECHFCNKKYVYNKEMIDKLFK